VFHRRFRGPGVRLEGLAEPAPFSRVLPVAWGVFLKRPSGPGAGLAACATALLVATARTEEAEDRRYFGTAHDTYTRDSKMFIPFVL